MAEQLNDLTQKIWMHIHGELDEQADRELREQIREHADVARAFRARHELDLLIGEAVKAESALPAAPEEATPAAHPPDGVSAGTIVAIPLWVWATRIAAVFAVLLAGLYLAVPRGPVQWGPTQVTRLNQTRSADAASDEQGLDPSAIRKTCADLRRAIEDGYEGAREVGEEQTWRLGLSVIEHAEGAFEVQVAGRQAGEQQLTFTIARRYPGIAAFETDVRNLARDTLRALQGHEF